MELPKEDLIVVKAKQSTSDEEVNNCEFDISNDLIEHDSDLNNQKLLTEDIDKHSNVSSHSESTVQAEEKPEKTEDEAEIQSEDDPKNTENPSKNEMSENSGNLPQPNQEIVDAVHQTDIVKEGDKTCEKNSKEIKKSAKKRTPRSQSKQTLNDKMANYKSADLKYMLSSTLRQRRYFLQLPRGVNVETPGDECEIFISNIPINLREGELIPLFDRFGTIWELRLLMSQRNPNRNAGFAFVRFTTSSAASEATQKFDKYEILPGKYLSIRLSQPNLSLFVGNIHRGLTRDQIHEKMSRQTKGLVRTFLKNSSYEETKNCGFCFLEYENHQAAVNARRLLGNRSVWGRHLFVDWAQRRVRSRNDGQECKTVFVNFLPKEMTEERLKEMFEIFGSIERITKIKDYAFILYDDHSSAVDAVNKFDKTTTGANQIDISLAMPKMTKRSVPSTSTFNAFPQRFQHSQQYFGDKWQFGSSFKLNMNNRQMGNRNRFSKYSYYDMKGSSNKRSSKRNTTD